MDDLIECELISDLGHTENHQVPFYIAELLHSNPTVNNYKSMCRCQAKIYVISIVLLTLLKIGMLVV